MRLVLTAALLLAPLAAQAQFVPRSPPVETRMPGITDMGTQPQAPSVGHDLSDARDLIRDGRADGALSKQEARALKREARQIGSLAERYGRDGLSDPERREIETRTQLLRAETLARRQSGNGDKP
ncbi:MAG: hypothetical protein C0520_16130 [Sphingopyxis sp.]|nr:hypothetical protein [Sphingopyxis sp.]